MYSLITRRLFSVRCRNYLPVLSQRPFCDNNDKNITIKTKTTEKTDKLNDVLGAIASKYQVFRNEDSSTILDINEERYKYEQFLETQEEIDSFAGINLNRGITGVFDIEDLVDVLKRENAVDVFVVSIPASYKYVDYICVVSGKSYRHLLAIAQFVRRVYKKKRNSTDIIPKIEGENCKEWIAMDLGNIALHVFSEEARIKYDLESLWSVGEEYDEECNKPDDPIVTMLEKLSIYPVDLKPQDKNG